MEFGHPPKDSELIVGSDSDEDPPPLFERMKQLSGKMPTSVKTEGTKRSHRSSKTHTKEINTSGGKSLSEYAFEIHEEVPEQTSYSEEEGGANTLKAEGQLATSTKNVNPVNCCPKRSHIHPDWIKHYGEKVIESGQTCPIPSVRACSVATQPHRHTQSLSYCNKLAEDVCDSRVHSQRISSDSFGANVHVKPPQEASLLGSTASSPIVLD